jgi:glycosyltransferase involved in cell wall biosynthesis
MKILFTQTPPFNPYIGGVSRTTYKLGKYFTESGLSIGYYSFSTENHVKAEYGRLYHSNHEGKTQNLENIKDLEIALADFNPDIVINQMPYEKPLREALANAKATNGFILLGCLRNSLFSVIKNLDAYGQQILPQPFGKWFQNKLGRGVLLNIHYLKHRKALKAILDKHDRFVLLTPPNREELQYFVGNYQQAKVTSIPNSIPEVHNNSVKQKVMLHVGRLNIPQKRSDLLLPFWKQVHEQLPDWEFAIVGDGPYKPYLEQQIKEENIPGISLQGYQIPEVFYEKAALFIMPSAYEGFPNVILEAQSYGLVPLAFNSYPALSWIVNDQKDAILSTPYNTKEMANQAINLAKDPSRLASMKQNAYYNANRFTIDKVGKEWLKLFNDLTSYN